MTEFTLHRIAGDSDTGDYELRFDDETEQSWIDVTRVEANELAKQYIGVEIMGFGPPKARVVFKQIQVHIPFHDDT